MNSNDVHLAHEAYILPLSQCDKALLHRLTLSTGWSHFSFSTLNPRLILQADYSENFSGLRKVHIREKEFGRTYG